jgi:hypothetical protein
MIKTVVIADVNMGIMLAALADKDVVASVLEDVMTGARNEWIKLAQTKLNSSRRDYINGIQEVVVEKFSASVTLLGLMPNYVENGMSPFNMHSTLLGPDVPVVPWGSGQKGKHARKDGGFYRVIPFRHQTPGTIGQGGGAPMGTQYAGMLGQSVAASLGKKIHEAAKALKPTTSEPGKATQWGERLPEGLAPKLKSTHTTDIYSGMVRQEKKYESATQSTYATFRVISDGQPDKWMHPGIEPAHLADDVEKYLDKVAPAAFAMLVNP